MKQTANDLLRTKSGIALHAFRVLLLATTLFIPTLLLAQRMVNGKVTDASGAPVKGASIQVKGTTVGTSTDDNGNFTIAAEKGAVLLVSNVGFFGY